MIFLEEVEVGLGRDNIQVILAEMTEVVVEGQNQIQELVLIETELDVLSVGDMIISLNTIHICKQKRTRTNTNVYFG